MQVRRLALWAVLFVLLAFTIYGIVHQRLFAQFIWSHIGLERFLIFTGAYALVFAIFFLSKPGLFPIVTVTAAIAFTIAATGPIPLLAVALILFSSLVLGEWILPDTLLATLLGLCIYMFALSITALAPVNYSVVYLIALTAPLLARPRAAAARLARIPSLWKPLRLTRSEQLASGALIFVLLLHWLAALAPEVGPDALAVHLVVPSSVALHHQWPFDVRQHLWSVMPMGADWCFTLAYLLGGETAARLLNLTFLFAIAALLYSTMRKWLPPAPSLILTALFAATPLVQLTTGSLFVENLWALLILGALVSLDRYRELARPAYLYLTFALLGAAAATKPGALSFLVPFAMLAIGKPSATSLRRAALALACFLIFAAPPYLTAFAKTGNPVFPYLARYFASPYNDLALAFQGAPPGPHLALGTFYDLTFRTSLYREVQDGAIGFQYFLLLPLAILLLRRKTPYLAIAGAVTALLAAVITLASDPGVRYLYPILPLATIFIASAFAVLRTGYARLYPFAISLVIALLGLNLYFLPSSSFLFKDFAPNPLSSRARSDYITAHAPERHLIAHLNQAHPGQPVAFLETNAIAELRAPSVTATWHNVEFYDAILSATTPADCLRIVEDHGAHLIVGPVPGSAALITTTPIEAFLRHCTATEMRSGNFYAGRVQDTCPSPSDQPGPVLPPGDYDDFDERVQYTGLWFRGQFAGASNGTLTYSKSPGASMLFRFTGAEVRYVYTKAFNRGIAEISLDGARQATLDLYSPTIQWKATLPIRAAGLGPHTLEIRVTGRRNPAATDAHVDVDALIVTEPANESAQPPTLTDPVRPHIDRIPRR